MICYKTSLKFHNTDASGRIFYSTFYRIASEALQEYVLKKGFSFQQFYLDPEVEFPIVHSSANYIRKIDLGEEIRVDVTIGRIGTTSIEFNYKFFGSNHVNIGDVKTVHVAVSVQTGKKTEIPAFFKEKFNGRLGTRLP